MNNTLDDIKAALVELNTIFPRPGFSVEPSEPYDLQTSFVDSYPNVRNAGVYVLLNEAGVVLRIGKASCGRNLGDRLGDYFRKDGKVVGRGVSKNDVFKEVRYVVTIPVPMGRSFEAPAIEEFLIARVKAPLNVIGVGL